MSSIDYKQKYIKYKNKYIELKALEELNKLNQQTGGFAYAPGEYVFFIPANKDDFDSQIPKNFGQKQLVDDKGNILGLKGLDDLTNYLGDCTKFLRVGRTTTGFDIANTYNTLYANQSTGSVVKREANDAWVAAKPYVDYAINTTKQGVNQNIKKDDNTDSTIHTSDLENTNKIGGDGNCVKVPKKLPKNLLIGTQNEITEDKLMNIVEFIRDNGLQGTESDNRITRIIYVKKPLVPGKPTTIDMARNFVVNYQGDNLLSVTKK
jgi:hypothetical protein